MQKKSKKTLFVFTSVVLASSLFSCGGKKNDSSSSSFSSVNSSDAGSSVSSSHTHAYGDWQITVKPTLSEGGKATRTCADDTTHVDQVDLPALSDTSVWSVKSSTDPDCTNKGETVYTSVYGDVTVEKEALNHSWGSWTIIQEPTLSEEGKASRVCAHDESHVDPVTLPVLSDTSVWKKTTVPATCEAKGQDTYTSEYGVVNVEIPALEHDYGNWQILVEPTLSEEGSAERVCANDPTHVDPVTLPVLSDTSVWTKTTVPATCEAKGQDTYTSEYGVVNVEIPALEHDYGDWKITVKPTLSDSGSAERVCAHDSTHVDRANVPALSDTSVWSVKSSTDPDCTNKGETVYTSVYGDVTVEKEALNHDFGVWHTDIEPTLTEEGLAYRTCSRCDEEETKAIPALSDALVWTKNEENSVNPTETTTGSFTFDSDEFESVTIEVPALSDTATWSKESVAPTCTLDGKDTYTSVYGMVEITVAKLNHAYGNWEIVVEPTLSEEGSAERICANDPTHVDPVTLPVLSDTLVWEVYDHVDATDSSDGYTIYDSEYGQVRVIEPAPYGQWTLPSDAELDFGQEVTLTKYSQTGGENLTATVTTPSDNIQASDVLEGDSAAYSLTQGSSYAFTYDPETKTYTSNNKGVGSSTAAMTFTAKVNGTLTFTVYCSGETNYDYFYQSGNSTEKVGSTAGVTKEYSIEMTAGDSVTLNYRKDGSGDRGDDCAIVSQLSFSSVSDVKDFVILDFSSMCDAVIEPMIVNRGGSVTLKGAERSGYVFEGWYDSTLSVPYGEKAAFTDDYTVLYAKWTKGYTATVHFNNGDADEVYVTRIGDELVLANPTYPGYKFAGWFTSADFQTGTEFDPSAYTSEDIDIYAKWEEAPAYTGVYHIYEIWSSTNCSSRSDLTIDEEGNVSGLKSGTVVSYDPTSGKILYASGSSTYMMYYKDGVIAVPYSDSATTFKSDLYVGVKETVSKAVQYSFTGDDNTSNGTKLATLTTAEKVYNVMIKGDVLYTNLTFTSTDGTPSDLSKTTSMGTIVVKNADGETLLAKGYNGSAWTDLDEVYGVYTADGVSVTLDGIGNYTDTNGKSGVYTIGEGVVSVWISQNNTVTEYLEYVLNGESYTVSKPEVTITYVTGDGHSDLEAVTVNKNVPVTLPELSEENWVFNGWFLDSLYTEAVPEDFAPGADVTLYAKFSEPVSLTIHYNSDALTDTVRVYSKGDTTDVEDPTLSWEGHLFAGFYTSDDFAEGTEWTNSVIETDLTVYAKWEIAPSYVGTTYGFTLEGSTTSGGKSSWRTSLTATVDESLSGTGTAWPLNGSFTIERDATDASRLTIVKGSSTYSAYYDADEKIWVILYSNTMPIILSANGETGSISTGDVSSSYWNGGKNRAIRYTDPSGKVHDIYIDNGTVYFGVQFADGFLDDVTDLDTLYSQPSVTITTSSGTQFFVYSSSGLQSVEAKDGYEGTYTGGDLGEIRIDGLGVIQTGDEVGSYAYNAETLVFEVYLGNAYYEIALDATSKTYTSVQPTVTLTFDVPSEGTIATETSVIVNKNVGYTLPEVTITDPLYEFKGWYFDALYTEAVPEEYVPDADATLYARIEEVPQGLSKGTATLIELTPVEGKSGSEFTIAGATTDEEHLNYYFKLVVTETENYYFKYDDRSHIGHTGNIGTSTYYQRFVFESEDGTTIGTAKSFSDMYNNNKMTLEPGVYYIRANFAEGYTSGVATSWGSFSFSVATSDHDDVDTAVALTIGESYTTAMIERTDAYLKFDVVAGKTYTVSGSHSPTIYLGDPSVSGTATNTAIKWSAGTATITAEETTTYYIQTMYDGVTFTVTESE